MLSGRVTDYIIEQRFAENQQQAERASGNRGLGSFTQFDTETGYDYVSLSEYGVTILRCSGNELNYNHCTAGSFPSIRSTYVSIGSNLTVSFTSDDWSTAPGYSFEWS